MDALTQERRPAPEPEGPGSAFSPDLGMLKLVSSDRARGRLRLTDALAVVQRMRDAILSHSNGLPDRVQALLSGHDQGGSPLLQPHLAILPIASVGHRRADGRIHGMALVLPRSTSENDRRQVLRILERVRRLLLGPLGAWNVFPSNEPSDDWTAHTAGASHWATVTPLVFDAHPKAIGETAQREELTAMVSRACAHVGLPSPREVIATQVSAHTGTPPAHAFPRIRRKDGHERRHSHVIVTFDRPVVGPVILGAGRYRGYGVLRPLLGTEEG